MSKAHKVRGKWKLEVTDTMGGEANYAWVNREEHRGDLTDIGVVRKLKALMGMSGKHVIVDDSSGDFTIRPPANGPCIIGFATWEDC